MCAINLHELQQQRQIQLHLEIPAQSLQQHQEAARDAMFAEQQVILSVAEALQPTFSVVGLEVITDRQDVQNLAV
jgi:hypothetical protein